MDVPAEAVGAVAGGGSVGLLVAAIRFYFTRRAAREDQAAEAQLVQEERRTIAAERAADGQVATGQAIASLATSVSQVALEVRDTRRDVAELRRDLTPVHGIEREPEEGEVTGDEDPPREDDTPVHSIKVAARPGRYKLRGGGGREG